MRDLSLSVSFVLPEVPIEPSGGPRVVYEYANHLAARGHRVTIVHLRAPAGGPLRTARHAARNARGAWRARTVRRGAHWMEHDPRIEMRYLHGLDPAAIARALPAADFLVATFWTTWGPISLAAPDRGVKLQLVQAYEVWAAPTEVIHGILLEPTLKVVVSPSLAETLVEIGVPRESVHVVPNGLDHRIFRCTRAVAERAPRVAFMVHLGIQKGLDVAIATLERTRVRRPDVAAIGYGIPARPRSLPDWVEYVRLPSPERLADLLNGSSIFLCASRNEGWGLPVTEAMACGCAVVSTRNGGVESYAVDHRNALLCEIDDVGGMTDAVVALLNDEDQRVQLASAGLETVRAFDWRQTASKFEEILLASSS